MICKYNQGKTSLVNFMSINYNLCSGYFKELAWKIYKDFYIFIQLTFLLYMTKITWVSIGNTQLYNGYWYETGLLATLAFSTGLAILSLCPRLKGQYIISKTTGVGLNNHTVLRCPSSSYPCNLKVLSMTAPASPTSCRWLGWDHSSHHAASGALAVVSQLH